MIINIRGTSGSGKSFIVKKIMADFETKISLKTPNRKQPVGYLLKHPERQSLFVPGHYETPCGGCDTLKTFDQTFELVRNAAREGNNVLLEGLLLNAEFRHTALLAQEFEVRVLALNVPLEVCLASVNRRRREKKPEATDVNPENTTSKWNQTKRCVDRLVEAGVTCHWGNREETETLARQLLKISLNMPGSVIG